MPAKTPVTTKSSSDRSRRHRVPANGHDKVVTPDDERPCPFPSPQPSPKGRGGKRALRDFHTKAPKANPRACAAQLLAAVFAGRSLTELLQTMPCVASDAPFLQALCYGLLREHPRQQLVLETMLEKPLKPQDSDIKALLLAGLYQLEAMNVPPHAVVNESVQACRLLGKAWAAKLVNAVLRRYIRDTENTPHQPPSPPLLSPPQGLEGKGSTENPQCSPQASAKYQHAMPGWLLQRLVKDWPEHWQAICSVLRQQAPLCLRVNQTKTTVGEYLGLLRNEGFNASIHGWIESALILDQAVAVNRLPGFSEGLVSVQDAGAQLAAALLNPVPGERILDACAAPGGKTGHLLEWGGPGLAVTAIDKDAKRLARVQENLSRLGLEAKCIQGDITQPSGNWAKTSYHAILLDAPCSATGVIRRHPDIKVLRRDTDIAALAQVQLDALKALWPLLLPGGRLLYATCSLLRAENEHVISAFLQQEPSARERALALAGGQKMPHGWQLLPGEADTDGFYYALLEKSL